MDLKAIQVSGFTSLPGFIPLVPADSLCSHKICCLSPSQDAVCLGKMGSLSSLVLDGDKRAEKRPDMIHWS